MERGFDIANHFCEYAEVVSECGRYSPLTQNAQLIFLRYYLDSLGQSDIDEKELLKEVEPFTMASDILWGLYGLLQSIRSEIDYDFWKFCLRRLQNAVETYRSLRMARNS
eukprot:GHVS01032431.1.p1 GENE.GHVS01032431.1~~GHVS01032431.1.p1  ORF type:complete len:110 (+),score=12.67 GHVS01032431.1:365-694(+)